MTVSLHRLAQDCFRNKKNQAPCCSYTTVGVVGLPGMCSDSDMWPFPLACLRFLLSVSLPPLGLQKLIRKSCFLASCLPVVSPETSGGQFGRSKACVRPGRRLQA